MYSQPANSLLIYVDGSSRGNPGPSGIGIVVFASVEQTKPIQEISKYIGITTNNMAEYEAVISALKWIVKSNNKCATIKLDSELVYNQVIGKYKVRSSRMAVQLKRVKILKAKIKNLSFQLIPRSDNKSADHLAQKASKKN
ncbi:reverse transcriptase-like protein [candidate division WOR-3 bacterium]|nr:reverse transcriptase-like protein [candidate division WOR-3 bacterium]